MKKIWKDNAKLILAIFVTVVIASGATYAATTMYDSNIVGYDNTTSGLRSTNVQSALDELYGNVAEVIIDIKSLIGDSTLTTTAQTLIGAINELDDYMIPQTVQHIGGTGDVSSVKISKMGRLCQIAFSGTFYGANIPSSCVPLFESYNRIILIAGQGKDRYPAHMEASGDVFIHINGGETLLPKDGTYNVYGTGVYFTYS